jgi:hypothetical protein
MISSLEHGMTEDTSAVRQYENDVAIGTSSMKPEQRVLESPTWNLVLAIRQIYIRSVGSQY